MPNPMTPLLLTSTTLGDLGEDVAKQKPDVYFLGDKADAYESRECQPRGFRARPSRSNCVEFPGHGSRR